MRRHRRYIPTQPKSILSGLFCALNTPSTPLDGLTTELYVKFSMRCSSWTGGGASSHQWGQFGAAGNRKWTYSIHANGHPRLAVYPLGTDASLIGPECLEAFPWANNEWAWAAAYCNLDSGGGNRTFQYWTSKLGIGNPIDQPQYWDDMGGPVVEAGATSFFAGSNALIQNVGGFGTEADRMGGMEIRETPQSSILVRCECDKWCPAVYGSFVDPSGPNAFTDRDGRVWTSSAFDSPTRAQSPRPYAA